MLSRKCFIFLRFKTGHKIYKMHLLKRVLLSLFLVFFSVTLLAQDIGNIDFENLTADQLSDAQIIQLYERIQDRGLTIAEVEAIALARGMSPSEVAKLRNRLNQLRTQGIGTQGQDLLSEDESRLRQNALTDLYETDNSEAVDTLDFLLEPVEEDTLIVFGEQIFSGKNLTFEPSLNIPTPKNYTLGAGDELIVDIWGAAENTYQLEISPEGTVQISNLGPISVSGLTIEEASARLIDRLSSLYSGLKPPKKDTFAQVTLGSIRSIKVSIVGEVERPGTYTLSSLATVFNALYAAGGPTDNGTYRSIKVLRDGKQFKEVDVYDFLVDGNLQNNIVLKDQDIIKVDPFINRVTVEGETKREGIFETKEGETFADLLEIVGGFNQNAYKKRVKVERVTDTERSIIEISLPEEANTVLRSGDKITIGKVLDRFRNRVQIKGAVFRPGYFQLEQNPTLYTLIQNAEGLTGDAFLDRAIVYRTNPDYTIKSIPVNLRKLFEAPEEYDLDLVKDDMVVISSIFELREEYTISISGEVNREGTFPYVEDMTLKDLLFQAKGFTEKAASYNIEIARRILDDGSGEIKNQLAEIFTIDLENGLAVVESVPEFRLMPYDQVFVRKSPSYEDQRLVTITGEVLFPGTYAISTRDFRLSDLIEKSGGLTEYAFPEGASLERKPQEVSDMELEVNLEDSVTEQRTRSLNKVGIRLEEALRNPDGEQDLLLQEGDIINVPKRLETVQVRGEVLYPVNVRYDEGKKFKSYISSAGGFTDQANTKKAYVVYANGEVARTKKFLFFRNYPEVRPGAVVIIPPKEEKQRLSTAERITVMSTIVSLAAIVTNTIFQIRREN